MTANAVARSLEGGLGAAWSVGNREQCAACVAFEHSGSVYAFSAATERHGSQSCSTSEYASTMARTSLSAAVVSAPALTHASGESPGQAAGAIGATGRARTGWYSLTRLTRLSAKDMRGREGFAGAGLGGLDGLGGRLAVSGAFEDGGCGEPRGGTMNCRTGAVSGGRDATGAVKGLKARGGGRRAGSGAAVRVLSTIRVMSASLLPLMGRPSSLQRSFNSAFFRCWSCAAETAVAEDDAPEEAGAVGVGRRGCSCDSGCGGVERCGCGCCSCGHSSYLSLSSSRTTTRMWPRLSGATVAVHMEHGPTGPYKPQESHKPQGSSPGGYGALVWALSIHMGHGPTGP